MSSPLAIIDQKRTIKDLFSKFNHINDPLVSEFTTSIPETFADAVDNIKSLNVNATDFVIQNRKILKSFIQKFHSEAGTISTNVEDNIRLLDDPSTLVLVSTHQPNLFAYSGVFKKIVLLETLKNSVQRLDKKRKIINLFLIIDHDFIDELWIRLAQLPSMQHSSGIMELRLPISESQRWQMVCNLARPRQAIINGWKHQIRSWINKSAIDTDKKMTASRNLEQFWQYVEKSYSRSKSYADLNSFIMSGIVNEIWNYNTLFVRLTEIPTVFENGFAHLISNFGVYSDALRKAENLFMNYNIDTGVSAASHLQAPVWIHCKCGSKASAKISKNGHETVLFGPCISCGTQIELNIGTSDNPDLKKHIHNLSPRAIPIPLLLSRDLGISCYASGTGGIGYLVDGSLISKKLGVDLPIVLVWPSKDKYNGIGQTLALKLMKNSNVEDIDTHMQMLAKQSAGYEVRIRPILLERAEKIRNHEPIDELLARLFVLKNEQRKIRQQMRIAEKIRNAINVSPCIIDYAVNFGIETTESRWKRHLLDSGDLASPVVI
jgi:hypothetical protein